MWQVMQTEVTIAQAVPMTAAIVTIMTAEMKPVGTKMKTKM